MQPDFPALYAAIDNFQAEDADVSGWSVGMHIHHSAKALIGVSDAIASCTTPCPPIPSDSMGAQILAAGAIPRGVAESPAAAVPDPSVAGSREALKQVVDHAKARVDNAANAASDAWFEHPILGLLNADGAKQFLVIHTNHHLGIINDIVRAS